MANPEYNGGVPTQGVNSSPPDDYQRVQPTALQGVEALGTAAYKTADVYNQAAVDNGFNDLQDTYTKLMYGDPSKTVTGPDGQPMQDTGYLGLKGRAALDARPAVEKQLQDKIEEIKGGLATEQQQQAFEVASRRYRSNALSTIGSHASTQSDAWAGEVNKDTIQNSFDAVTKNPLDPKTVASATADAQKAALQNAALQGANLNDPTDPLVKNAIITARRGILAAQVNAIGADDPSTALRILQKNKDIAGTDYDNLYTSLRARADQADGDAAAKDVFETYAGGAMKSSATSYSNPALPIYHQTATDIPGGMSAAGLARTVQIESGGDPSVTNASGHTGLGQFSDETAKALGIDPKDPEQSIIGIQRNAVQSAKVLTPILGRPPTDAELYLAHQQGAGGAAKLLQNPDAPAASIIGTKAVIQNGGTQGMTSAQFVSMWTHKFGGTTPEAGSTGPIATPGADNGSANWTVPEVVPLSGAPAAQPPPEAPSRMTVPPPTDVQSTKADAVAAIMERTDLTPEARTHALAAVNQLYAAQATADATTAAAKKQASDNAANGYVTQMLSGQTQGLDQKIANDPNLSYEAKLALNTALVAHADNSASAATAAYGPGYWKAYQQVLADPGDPSRIADPVQVLKRAGPGGDLTLAGADQLIKTMTTAQKSVDGQAVQATKAGLMAYAKSKLSFQDDTGPLQIKDPEGERIFNARFIPQFEAAFQNATKDGSDPWKFLTQDNVDKMIAGLRNPHEMAMAKLQASSGIDESQVTAPAAPQGVDPDGWKLVVTSPPTMPDGKPSDIARWTQAVTLLQQNPTPQRIAQFDAFFGKSGVQAQDVLDVLGVKGKADDPDAERKAAIAAAYPGNHAVINGVEDLGLPMPQGQ